jgi:hypothetical protein
MSERPFITFDQFLDDPEIRDAYLAVLARQDAVGELARKRVQADYDALGPDRSSVRQAQDRAAARERVQAVLAKHRGSA